MKIPRAIELFLDHRRRRTRETRRQYRRWLTDWSAWRLRRPDAGEAVADVSIDDFRDYLHYLEVAKRPFEDHPYPHETNQIGLKPASVAAARRTLRAFWRFLDGEELLTPTQTRFFTNDRIPAPIVEEPPREYCDEATFQRLLAACDSACAETAARNRAILWLLIESGMRVGELCSLDDRYVDLRERQAMVRGKGRHWRPVFWQPPGAIAFIRYILVRRGPRDIGPLFRGTSIRNNGGAMSPDSVRNTIKRIARAAGVALPAGCPVHWLRHSFAKHALEHGLDESQVGQFLGHRDPASTRIYTRDTPARLKALYDQTFGAGDDKKVLTRRRWML
jgi:site-specific recombinase XerD